MYSKEQKKAFIKKHTPPSSFLLNGIRAFVFGGFICALGQVLFLILSSGFIFNLYLDEKTSYMLVSFFFIFLASLLTGIGVFDKIAKHAGAGTIVPVTGFSNSTTSAAMDSKEEGLVLGLGAKIFTVAGPVILYGILSGSLYGLIYYSYKIFFG